MIYLSIGVFMIIGCCYLKEKFNITNIYTLILLFVGVMFVASSGVF